MKEKANISKKTSEKKQKSNNASGPKQDLSGSLTSPADQILHLQRTIGNQVVQKLIKSSTIQAKLTIGRPGDKFELEADRTADKVMNMQGKTRSLVQRQGNPQEEEEVQAKLQEQKQPGEEKVTIQSKGAASQPQTLTSGLDSSLQSLKGGGKPLPGPTRSFFESRFGRDFSQVRLHTGSRAAEAAKSISARAFTMGKDVVFGEGEYSTGASAGKHLLAHELTHVVQQDSSYSAPLMRAPLEQRHTEPIPLDKTKIEKWVGRSYWLERVGELFKPILFSGVQTRFTASPEERDAVLSVLLKVRPTGQWKSGVIRIVTIPARAGVTSSKPLIYKFTYWKKSGTKPQRVNIEFISAGSAAAVTTAPAPPKNFTPSLFGMTFKNFPPSKQKGVDDFDDYMNRHPEEHKQLFNWIQNQAPQNFDQVIVTDVTVQSRSRKSSFKVKGNKTGPGNISGLNIDLLGSAAPQTESPPAGYTGKEGIDVKLEKLQSTSRPKRNRLGTITGVSTLATSERVSIKFAIYQYFEYGKTRNAEVDAIIPIPNTTREVYFTIRFETGTNNVSVERVGEEGLSAGARVSPNEMDLKRVHGYAANSKDPAALKAWLKKRYKGVTPSGTTVQDITTNFNTQMKANAGKPAWFEKNYDIFILDATKGKERLKQGHTFVAQRLRDIKDFDLAELNKLEFALQTMSLPLLKLLINIRMVRQKVYIVRKGTRYVEVPKKSGHTLITGSTKTVLILDNAFKMDDLLFVGGKGGVRPESTTTFAHELGHVIGRQANIQREFNKFVTRKKIKPVSKYAGTKKSTEFFPEAFAFYQLDPEFMENQQPELYKWFEVLSKTGKPPPTP